MERERHAERALGALILGVALVLALVILGGRQLIGRGSPQTPQAPVIILTPVVLTPVNLVPVALPTVASATPMAASPVPEQTTMTRAAAAPITEPAGAAGKTVCLDIGHGGSDLGNVRLVNGTVALREKDFTLSVGLALGAELEGQGVNVVYTRTTDTEVNPNNADVNGDGEVAAEGGEAHSDQLDDLQARVLLCNAAAADLLVSIHFNGAENKFLSGYEVWYNGDRPFSGDSARFATIVHEELAKAYATAGYAAVDRGIGTEDHAVTGPARPGKLVPSEMPGAVVEGLFLSNDADAAFIQSPGAEGAIVGAYDAAILRYFAGSGP